VSVIGSPTLCGGGVAGGVMEPLGNQAHARRQSVGQLLFCAPAKGGKYISTLNVIVAQDNNLRCVIDASYLFGH